MDVCARMAGHSSIKTTVRYYTSASASDEVRVLEALGVAAGSPGDKAALAGA